MSGLATLYAQPLFKYFEEISRIPHGSGNMDAIASYCMEFASKHGLKAVRDDANNVIIYKPATVGYENAKTVILQGHLDMVCQKAEDSTIDFTKDALDLYIDGDFIKAHGTTLGADNGIAVAMVLAILASDDIPHPALEAVFTTDEEIGMIGAMQLDMGLLHGKNMINLDAEEDDTLTVSCAGGCDVVMTAPIQYYNTAGTAVTITLRGLQGGHSGVEIDKGRVNADMLAGRVLQHLRTNASFDMISITGGDKGNAIPNLCRMQLCVKNADAFIQTAQAYLQLIQAEISDREPQFRFEITGGETGTHAVWDTDLTDRLIFALTCAPNGIIDMSTTIEGLVETSLNLGVLSGADNLLTIHFALRSNKATALAYLEERMRVFAKQIAFTVESFGHYPPWEYNDRSQLQSVFKSCYMAQRGTEPKVEAIHAGLECGVFASGIEGLDCIAIGPALYDVHTVNERLCISSTNATFALLTEILSNCR